MNKVRLENEIDNLPVDARFRKKIHDMTFMQNFGKLYAIMSDEKRKALSPISLKKFKYIRAESKDYNFSKSEDGRQPNCPEEKKEIKNALEHFGIV